MSDRDRKIEALQAEVERLRGVVDSLLKQNERLSELLEGERDVSNKIGHVWDGNPENTDPFLSARTGWWTGSGLMGELVIAIEEVIDATQLATHFPDQSPEGKEGWNRMEQARLKIFDILREIEAEVGPPVSIEWDEDAREFIIEEVTE